MTNPATFKPITDWGRWLHDLAQLSDDELAERDVAEVNLWCAADLPQTDNSFLGACLEKVDDWAILVDRYTGHLFREELNLHVLYGHRNLNRPRTVSWLPLATKKPCFLAWPIRQKTREK